MFPEKSPTVDVVGVMILAYAVAWLVFLSLACVTRTTVCLETAHGVNRDPSRYRPDTVGASVCSEFERP